MNTGACDCCNDPFLATDPFSRCEPLFEQRSRDTTRQKCGEGLNGIFYGEIKQDFECRDDPLGILWITTRTRTNTKTSAYFDPDPENTDVKCSFSQTYDPPISSAPPLCNINTLQPIGEPTGTNEITDASLRGDILGIIQGVPYSPEDGSFNVSQPAFAYYVADNFTGFATDAEYRISHRAIPTCYLKVWIGLYTFEINESFEFGALLDESDEVYIWQPTSNPCLPDPTKSIRDEAQIIKSSTYSIAPPDETNTAKVAFIKKYSFLPNYEPDDPIVVNPFEIYRSDPDCKPNGVPNPSSGC